ncbi:hypothetical protein MNBD_GAMMA14-1699 [hydrothermal vent metagenome]|uniref:Poly-gamma-glutamate synthase subunit PgsB/CapB n=1 Tax=hydrothermal vent metagenome TaxID=652676 RepID=A0A3B0YVM4_9ZZZZ
MKTLAETLSIGLSTLLKRLERHKLDTLESGFRHWWSNSDLTRPGEDDAEQLEALLLFLLYEVEETLEQIYYLRGQRVEFDSRYAHAVTDQERRLHVLDFGRTLGADAATLKADRAAFSRWFGHDAVTDRFHRRHGEKEQHAAFCLGRIGTLSEHLISSTDDDALRIRLFRSLRLDTRIEPILAYDGDARVRIKAFACLAAALRGLPATARERQVKSGVLQYIYRAALDERHDLWIQCEALALLQHLSAESFTRAIRHRLEASGTDDNLFVRRRVVLLLGNNLARLPELADLLALASNDNSAFVRQAVAQALVHAPEDLCLTLFTRLGRNDADAKVRAATLAELPALLKRSALLAPLLEQTTAVLTSDSDEFVLRVTLQRLVEAHAGLPADDAAYWRDGLLPVLDRLHRTADKITVRRWAARAREHLWCQSEQQRLTLKKALAKLGHSIRPGQSRSLPKKLLQHTAPEELGRVLSLVAEDDFTLSLQRGLFSTHLHRGLKFGFRSWRFLHEFLNPATDKRQAFRHTIGRIAYGHVRAPAAYMAEQTETRVPGEPLYMPEEDGWRPYLPLVDEVISCLDEKVTAATVMFFTSEGVSELTAPPRFRARLRARLLLTRRFASYARLRNWREQDGGSPDAYVAALQKLGFTLVFRPHKTDDDSQREPDPAVMRFFPAILPVSLSEPGILSELREYFFSVYENTLYELSVFLVLVTTFFFGRHLYINRTIRKARERLPLVIGGWGTRGKSGTERIKAALFNALGYSVVSKTTGTEAMFLHGYRYGKLGEMFLFRPYDKATIWEQANLVRLADRLKTDVFLWECMALTPSYVKVLQQDWMRDDIATITNTYPDHEDLQGPAGINIPEVMTEFIPENSTLITSEEHMRPVLRADAIRKGTQMKSTGWFESGLLTDDILQRFPYDEHPNNIALVLSMADELGIERDFALKEMADRVVPDLGVLKSYPPAPLRHRTLEFINGMAANERLGFMGNWQRMGFADHDAVKTPGTWISTVINNREDRVPRSRVFADILVQDIRADRHFLIGSNLHGFLNYLEDSWRAFAATYTLWPTGNTDNTPDPRQRFSSDAQKMGVPVSEAQVAGRLGAILEGLGLEPQLVPALLSAPDVLNSVLEQHNLQEQAEAIGKHLRQWQQEYAQFSELADRLDAAGDTPQASLNTAAAALLWDWLQTRLVIIDDVHASGNNIIGRICEETPPGFHNRILGCQNIKGPGLDFVYRWQAWDVCYQACRQLASNDEVIAERGLRFLASFQEFGPLCEETVRHTLAAVRHSDIAQSERFQSQLQIIETSMQQQLDTVRDLSSGHSGTSRIQVIIHAIESFLDAGDAVKRRKRANLIYRDLANERISHARAVIELQKLNKRQKGGWLLNRLTSWLDLLRSNKAV